MKKEKEKPSYMGHDLKMGVHMIVVSIILVVMIFAMVWNTSGFDKVLEKSTEAYVRDVSYQLSNDIEYRLTANQSMLEQLADSIPRIGDRQRMEEFLGRKARILGFDAFVLIETDGSTVPDTFDISDLQDLSGIRASFNGETAVIYVEGQSLLFSAPVYSGDTVTGVLAGVRTKENIQEMIRLKSFDGKGLTCIADREGSVVISPTDLKPFLQLEDILQEGSKQQTVDNIIKMETNMENQESGVFHFIATDDTKLIISYHPIHVNGWNLLTIVPADLVSKEAFRYIFRMFLMVGGIIAAFILLLIVVARFYRKYRKQLEAFAFSDQITKGMNNAAFQLECKKMVTYMPPSTYVMVLLNVKGFKLINENFGIDEGNKILRYIYNVLKNHIHDKELVTRGEADYFFLCLRETSPERLQQRLDQMVKDINTFDGCLDVHYALTIPQGACFIEDPDVDITIIQDRARIACRSQNEKSRCVFYSADLIQGLKKEQELNALFAESLRNRDFQVYLQPKIRLKDGKIGGAEALVRWFHPERGMIFPSDFIPVFEKSENILQLDLYMFEEVCILLKRWMEEGRELFPVSVNLSRMHFRNLNFLQEFSQIKEKYHIPDDILELELTESIFFNQAQMEAVKSSIVKMHEIGFLCSLDDFGFGYSSLVFLKEFEVDTIKMDRRFFVDIEKPKTQHVIRMFIELANRLGIHIVAEGIETREQLEYLKRVKCDMIQGYIFSKPLSVPDFEKWRDSLEQGDLKLVESAK